MWPIVKFNTSVPEDLVFDLFFNNVWIDKTNAPPLILFSFRDGPSKRYRQVHVVSQRRYRS